MKVCKAHLQPEPNCIACEIDALRNEIRNLTLRVLKLEGEKNVCWPKKYVDNDYDKG